MCIFGGKFDFMLDYYVKEGKGVNPDFEIARIRELQVLETGMQQNLAGVLLSGPDAERVAEAKEAYKKLRDLYEHKRSKKLQRELSAINRRFNSLRRRGTRKRDCSDCSRKGSYRPCPDRASARGGFFMIRSFRDMAWRRP